MTQPPKLSKMVTNKFAMTPARYNEACRLMALGYSPRHAAYVVNIAPERLAEEATGQGGEPGIETLERECRITRTDRIKANIDAYPSMSLWPEQEVAA